MGCPGEALGLASNFLFSQLQIHSPKRNRRLQTGWEGFFPYYAGFPEAFARGLIGSASLPQGAVVLDPWNGSGTTTYTASRLGLHSIGLDLNPVMVIVARARLLPRSEADSIEPLSRDILRSLRGNRAGCDDDDPLLIWFAPDSASVIRAIEASIRSHLVGSLTITPDGTRLDRISGMAATFYVALFTACRTLAAPFKSSNPTWLRKPRDEEAKLKVSKKAITKLFRQNLTSMAAALLAQSSQPDLLLGENSGHEIRLGDSTSSDEYPESVDLVLTSPPYCTRIDYTAATRVELAVAAPILNTSVGDLGRRMIGSTRVPEHDPEPSEQWGAVCLSFLERLRGHRSKASAGYYYRTHLDYFHKMSQSLQNVSTALKPGAAAVLVVQNSYYKDVHNDLPAMIREMGEAAGLCLERSEEFRWQRSMSGVNPYTRVYNRERGALEAVLCFSKNSSSSPVPS